MNLTKKIFSYTCWISKGKESESLYKYVIDHLDADLAICIGDKFHKDTPLVTKSTYKWIFKEPDNWSKYFQNDFQTLGKSTCYLVRNLEWQVG